MNIFPNVKKLEIENLDILTPSEAFDEPETRDGFLPLNILSEKYGYAKDHIGRLARTGRIQAIRYGNRGQWYAREDQVRDYLASKEKRFSQEPQEPKITSYGSNSDVSAEDKSNVSVVALKQPRREVGIVLSALREDSKPEDSNKKYSGLGS